jgi:methylmalonyl-CoA/ethylmalonyl-CoA epimerase
VLRLATCIAHLWQSSATILMVTLQDAIYSDIVYRNCRWGEQEQPLIFSGIFHHVGVACRNIEQEALSLLALGYATEGPAITDPIQKVRVQFFVGGGPRVEMIEPIDQTSPVSGLLKRGTKFYHLAYEVADLDRIVEFMETQGYRAVGAAAPAAAFQMRRIIFLMAKSGVLVELIEAR